VWRVIEMVDGLLQVEEETLLLGSFLRNIGELPGQHRQPLPRHAEGAGPCSIPARARFGTRLD